MCKVLYMNINICFEATFCLNVRFLVLVDYKMFAGRGHKRIIYGHIDMDMSYARWVRTVSHSSHTSYSVSRKVLHQRTASHLSHTSHSVSHKWRQAAAAMRAHNVLCNS
jgi:hypothetical protein